MSDPEYGKILRDCVNTLFVVSSSPYDLRLLKRAGGNSGIVSFVTVHSRVPLVGIKSRVVRSNEGCPRDPYL